MAIFALTMRIVSELHWAAFPTTNFFHQATTPESSSHQMIFSSLWWGEKNAHGDVPLYPCRPRPSCSYSNSGNNWTRVGNHESRKPPHACQSICETAVAHICHVTESEQTLISQPQTTSIVYTNDTGVVNTALYDQYSSVHTYIVLSLNSTSDPPPILGKIYVRRDQVSQWSLYEQIVKCASPCFEQTIFVGVAHKLYS